MSPNSGRMIFDAEFFTTVGLDALPPGTQARYADALREQLVAAVHERLVERMAEDERARYLALQRSNKRIARAWLDIHFPDRRSVIDEEYARLLAAVADRADETVALELAFLEPPTQDSPATDRV